MDIFCVDIVDRSYFFEEEADENRVGDMFCHIDPDEYAGRGENIYILWTKWMK